MSTIETGAGFAQAPLDAETVHVWWWPDSPALAAAPGERRQRVDRRLRRALAHYLALPAERLRFAREPRGRPYLVHSGAPDFNLSDTRGGTVLAVASQGRVGIDLERGDRTVPALRLARRWFSEDEARALAELPEAQRAAAFIRLWTAKEAACKATGTGIYGRLDRWRFAPGSDRPRPPLPPEAGPPSAWRFLRLTPAPAFTVALACRDVAPKRVVRIEAGTDGD